MDHRKILTTSYIEDNISKLSQEETGKRQYYRPIYSLHKWWARRPGALFRSIILLAASPELSDGLFEPGNNGDLSEKSKYFCDHNKGNTIILDPFMGGGTTLVEANRLGARVIGCDINPVSFWIVRENLKPIDLEKLDHYFQQLDQNTGKLIKNLYTTNCDRCNFPECDSLYVFWVRCVNCSNCDNEVPLFKRTLLNEGMSRNKPVSYKNPAMAICPSCYSLNEWYGNRNSVCKQCNTVFDPQVGTYNAGYYKCPHCRKEKLSLIKTLRDFGRPKEKLMVIEYWCPRCKQRLYKTPDKYDLEKVEKIQNEFENSSDPLLIPKQKIPEGSTSERWRLHNYKYYHEIFNSRQLLAFNYLLSAIQKIPEDEYRNAFITIFSNSLEYNNMMTPYNYPHRKLHHLFNYHAMPLTTTPVENVVWGASDDGAGTFVNCYRRYVNAKLYCKSPFDKFKDSQGSIHTIHPKNEKIEANFVSSFNELSQTPHGTMLLCGNSAHLPDIPDESVDFVITDPPYYDNIHYSELSNFFYVWLSLLIKHPYFASEYVPAEQEAIVNKGINKGEEDYQYLLTSVFKECKRVLKKNGFLIFTFHHTKWQAWWTVLNAIVKSGFCVTDSFPVLSEYKVNPHIRNKQSLDMDLVLMCSKRDIKFEAANLSIEEIRQFAMNRISLGNLGNNRLFLYFMGKMLEVISKNWDTQKVDYEFFLNALTNFDDLVVINQNHIPEKISEPQQLDLF